MRLLLRFILPCCLLLMAATARAQWSGSVDLAGGFGMVPYNEEINREARHHGLVQGTFKVSHKNPKWIWSASLDGRWEPKDYDTQRGSVKDQLGVVMKTIKEKPVTVGLHSDFSWTPAKDRKYDFWVKYQYKEILGENQTVNLEVPLEEELKETFSYYYENPYMSEHAVSAGFKSSHQLGDPTKVLQSAFSIDTRFNQQDNQWGVFKFESFELEDAFQDPDMALWIYRITPRNTDLNTDFQVHLRDSVIRGGDVKLLLDPGIRINTQNDLDHNSGATLDLDVLVETEKEVWIDSVRLRERFDFLTVKAEPYLAAHFTWKALDVNADYGLQFHGRRLNDDDHRQPLTLHGIYPVGKGSVSWKIGQYHRLSLNNSLSVSHPDYFKICWYDRTGGYLNQLYRGNEKLPSTLIRTYGLSYDFKSPHFLSTSSVTMTRKENETDQTWADEEIEGRLYKVFTWINAADSWVFGFSQKLGYEGKIVSTHLGVNYNQARRVSRETGVVKTANDWRLMADGKVKFGSGWSIQADAHYQSKVATFFSIFSEYCVLNARIQKQWKKLTVYLEGRDLLDSPRTVSFESDDQTELWIEINRYNRRLVLLGLTWKL